MCKIYQPASAFHIEYSMLWLLFIIVIIFRVYVPWNILNTYPRWFQLRFIISCYKYHFTVLSKSNLLRNIEFLQLLLHLSWKFEKCKVIAYWLKPLAAGNCTWLESTCWLTSSLDLRETPSIFTTYVITLLTTIRNANVAPQRFNYDINHMLCVPFSWFEEDLILLCSVSLLAGHPENVQAQPLYSL